VAGMVDVVAADIKLPSACGKELWEHHRKFIELSADNVFVKIVITADSSFEEIQKAVGIIEAVSFTIPLFFQPVTPLTGANGKNIKTPEDDFIGLTVEFASKKLKTVKVLPQQHPAWGVK